MSDIAKRVFLLALVAATLYGCASSKRAWYGCDQSGFRGWNFAAECARLDAEARHVRR